MRRIVPFMLAALMAGCNEVATEYTQWTREGSTVTKKEYKPSSTRPCYKLKANGKFGMGLCTESAKYRVSISCMHGETTVNDSGLFEKLEEGQEPTIQYRTKRTISYDGKADDGNVTNTTLELEHDFNPVK